MDPSHVSATAAAWRPDLTTQMADQVSARLPTQMGEREATWVFFPKILTQMAQMAKLVAGG